MLRGQPFGRMNMEKKMSEDLVNCSSKSVIASMNKFIKTVNDMNAIVLVPSKLHEVQTPATTELTTDLLALASLINGMKNELILGKPIEDEDEEDTGNDQVRITRSELGHRKYSRHNRMTPSPVRSALTSSPSLVNQSMSLSSSGPSSISSGTPHSLTKQLSTNLLDVDDGFSSLTSMGSVGSRGSSYGEESDSEESDFGSKSLDRQSNGGQSSNDDGTSSNFESSQFNLLTDFRRHLKGLQSTLNRFTEYAEHVAQVYQNENPDL